MGKNWASLAAVLSVFLVSTNAADYWTESKQRHEMLLKSSSNVDVISPLDVDTDANKENVRLGVPYLGQMLYLNLHKNRVVSPTFKVSEFHANASHAEIETPEAMNCTFSGHVETNGHFDSNEPSFASISLCGQSVNGMFIYNGSTHFIEPLHPHIQLRYGRSLNSKADDGSRGLHILYSASHDDVSAPVFNLYKSLDTNSVRASLRKKRSYPDILKAEILTIELCLVVDKSMVEHYGDYLHEYLATIMNIVQHYYRLDSLGSAVNVVLTRLIILREDPPNLPFDKLTPDGIKIKKAFDKWQVDLNVEDDNDPNHFDFIMLYTRINMRQFDGIAELAKICDPLQSTGLAEDRGLRGAEVIAHELGHSLGMDHDHYSNDPYCRENGGKGSIMGTTKTGHKIGRYFWSKCSREALQFYTSLGSFTCLLDAPVDSVNNVELEGLPGQHVNVAEQCFRTCGNGYEPRLSGGRHSFCTDLYCVRRNKHGYIDKACHGKQVPLEGTQCAPDKHCINQECVPVTTQPIHGGWGRWEEAEKCTSTQGLSVRKRTRTCDNPKPQFGGTPCPGPNFDYVQCETEGEEWSYVEIDYEALRRQLCKQASWEYHKTLVPDETFVPGRCIVNCLNEETGKKYKRLFPNGTRCDGNSVCIDGWCKKLVCGHAQMLYEAVLKEDMCGVCFGNNTNCNSYEVKTRTTKKLQGDETCGLPVPRGKACLLKFPRGSRNIDFNLQNDRVYYKFVLRSYGTVMDVEGRGWGKFAFAGTNWFYNEFYGLISTKGPLLKDVEVLIETVSGNWKRDVWYIYQYHVRKETPTYPFHDYRWHEVGWGRCSQPCGGGLRVTVFICLRDDGLTVEDHKCFDSPKPRIRTERCNAFQCRPRWQIGLWSQCCRRTNKIREVRCVRPLGNQRYSYLKDEECKMSGPQPHNNATCLPAEINFCTGPVSHSPAQENGCTAGWMRFDDHCYQGFLKPEDGVDQDWAEYHCLAHSAHLAHVKSKKANDFIYKLLHNKTDEKRGWRIGAFIGLKWTRDPAKLFGGGDVRWMDDKTLPSDGFMNWADDTQPFNPELRQCVMLSGGQGTWNAGKWESVPCETKRDFVVCSRPAVTKLEVSGGRL